MQTELSLIVCPHCTATTEVPLQPEGAPITCRICSGLFSFRSLSHPSGHSAPAERQWTRHEAGLKLFLIGLLVLAGVAFMGWQTVWEPLEKMRRHEPNITYSMKIIFFLPLFAAVGAGLVLMGLVLPLRRETAPAHGRSGRGKLLGLLFFAAMLVPGWFLFSWFEKEAAKAGYALHGIGTGPTPVNATVPKMDIPAVHQPDFQQHQRRIQDSVNAARQSHDEAGKTHRQ